MRKFLFLWLGVFGSDWKNDVENVFVSLYVLLCVFFVAFLVSLFRFVSFCLSCFTEHLFIRQVTVVFVSFLFMLQWECTLLLISFDVKKKAVEFLLDFWNAFERLTTLCCWDGEDTHRRCLLSSCLVSPKKEAGKWSRISPTFGVIFWLCLCITEENWSGTLLISFLKILSCGIPLSFSFIICALHLQAYLHYHVKKCTYLFLASLTHQSLKALYPGILLQSLYFHMNQFCLFVLSFVCSSHWWLTHVPESFRRWLASHSKHNNHKPRQWLWYFFFLSPLWIKIKSVSLSRSAIE